LNASADRSATLILSDPQIARAFADMVARPSAPHTIFSVVIAAKAG
jgi:hypothetical protein